MPTGIALDAEIAAVVEEIAARPLLWEVPIAEARAAGEAETDTLCGPGEPVAEVSDIAVAGPAEPIGVRVYRPDGAHGLVVFFHGGGWVLGSLRAYDPMCRAMANASGATVASVDYRLAPEAPFPAAVEDAVAAASALLEREPPEPVVLAGDSAGGNLAAVVARRLRDTGLDDGRVRLQALVYPVCDDDLDRASYRGYAEGFGLTAATMAHFWRLYRPGPRSTDPDACPLRAADLRGLPPALVLLAEADVLRDEGEAYAAALREAGVPVMLRRRDGTVHGYLRWTGRTRIARTAVSELGGALRTALA